MEWIGGDGLGGGMFKISLVSAIVQVLGNLDNRTVR